MPPVGLELPLALNRTGRKNADCRVDALINAFILIENSRKKTGGQDRDYNYTKSR